MVSALETTAGRYDQDAVVAIFQLNGGNLLSSNTDFRHPSLL